MRYIGILIMAGAAIGSGMFAAECLHVRLEILQLLRQMIYHLKGQILYANATLPEALHEVGTRFSSNRDGIFRAPGEFFSGICDRLNEDRQIPFSQIWKEETDKISLDVPMSDADRQNLAALGENLGYADRTMQERTLLFYLEQTDDAIATLKQEVEVKGKLYRTLGMAAGVFLMVVLA